MLLKSVISFTAAAALALPASSFATEYQALKGTYVGNYQLTMNVLWPDDNGGPGTPFVLGRSMSHAYWQWDFDNKLLTWGGGRHNTIMDVTPAFQPYHLEQLASADKVAETEPNITHESEITIPFTDHGDGTYSVDYAHKIHLVLAELVNAPIGAANIRFSAHKDANGELVIRTLDADQDGVLGTVVEGVFPMPVQPQFDSVSMRFDDTTDSNNDGITDAVAQLLKLDQNATDSDEDTYADVEELGIFVRPNDTDEDGIIDATEPMTAQNASHILSPLTLLSQEKISLTAPSGEYFSFAQIKPLTSELNLPTQNDVGEVLNYDMGLISFNLTNFQGDSQVSLAFGQPIPAGLNLYQVIYTPTEDVNPDTNEQIIATKVIPLTWQAVDEQTVAVTLKIDEVPERAKPNEQKPYSLTHFAGTKVGLIATHTETNRVANIKPTPEPTPDSTPEPTVKPTPQPDTQATKTITPVNSGGGGSVGWGLFALIGFVLLARRQEQRR